VAEPWPMASDDATDGSDHGWLRDALLGTTPILIAAATGAVLWLAFLLGVRTAVTPIEMLPALPLAVGASLGGRLGGELVNLSHAGVWLVPLALPLAAALLVARSRRGFPPRTLAVGAATTVVLHAVVAGGLSFVEVYDPTSFATAKVAWVPVSSLAYGGVCWTAAAAISTWRLGRTVTIGAAVTVLLGLLAGAAVAIADGSPAGTVPVVALIGGALGPNAVGFSLIWMLGGHAGQLGGLAPATETFSTFARETTAWVWLLPTLPAALLAFAAWRGRLGHSGGAYGRRVRDVTVAVTVSVPLLASFAAPRARSGSRTTTETWLGVPDAPWSLVTPIVGLIVLVLVPITIAAVLRQEGWPAEALASLRTISRQSVAALAPQPPRPGHVGAPPYAPSHHAPAAWAASAPLAGASNPGPRPAAATPGLMAPAPGVSDTPPANPFEDDLVPPVSQVWSDVAPAGPPPGAPPFGPSPQRGAGDWRSAPPPSSPNAAPHGPAVTGPEAGP
jgi:hypothetical protein